MNQQRPHLKWPKRWIHLTRHPLSYFFIIIILAVTTIITTRVITARSAPPPWQPQPIDRAALSSRGQYLPNRPIPKTTKTGLSSQIDSSEGGIITYIATEEDTVGDIARRFGLSTETIIAANNLKNPDFLSTGQELVILPVEGVLHTVETGDTIEYIAALYGVTVRDIIDYEPNGTSDPNALLKIGQKLIIPGGHKPAPVVIEELPTPIPYAYAPSPSYQPPAYTRPAPTPIPPLPAPRPVPQPSGAGFVWPVNGYVSQYASAGHMAIDIGAPYGSPVVAAASGTVVSTAQTGVGYGYYIVIAHSNGYSTLYAHLSAILVAPGQGVAAGQTIGRIGTTGWSTGPHLHFEIRLGGQPVNPLGYL